MFDISKINLEEERERLRAFYRNNRRSLRTFNSDSDSMLALIQEEEEEQSLNKITNYFKNFEYSPRDGISISPPFMSFKNPLEGSHWRRRLTIKNTGIKSVEVRVLPPNSLAFEIDKVTNKKILLPGLSLQVWITYSFKRPYLLNTFVPIEINGNLMYYRLIPIIGSPHVVADPTFIDFQKVDINFQSKTKIVTLKNDGEKLTKFSLDVTERDISVMVLPMRGVIMPGSEVQLKIKVLGLKEGTFVTEFWIKSIPHIRVILKANIIVPKFEAYHPNSFGDSVLLDFPPTFVNNLKYESFVVRNLSSRSINFIVLGDINEELMDPSEIDTSKYPAYSIFKVCPVEGRMEPFEGRIFNATFSPTTNASRLKKNTCISQDFLAFFKIIRLHVSEVEDILKDAISISTLSEESMPESSTQSIAETSDSTSMDSLNESDSVSISLCINGVIENSRLEFVPDTLYFGDVLIGEKSRRVISITNPCLCETLTFRSIINPNARCTPNEGVLGPNKKLEVLVEVKANFESEPFFTLKFDVFAATFTQCPSLERKSRKVFPCRVKCFQNLVMISNKDSKPKLIKGFDSIQDYEFCDDIQLPKMKNDFPLIKAIRKEKTSEAKPTTEALILPLSPLQIYNVKAWPSVLHFGKVASRSVGYQKIEFENKNNFPVTIRLISQISNYIFFPEGNLVILNSKTKVAKLIGFNAKHEGTFNGCLNYVINENHSFELKLTVEIVDKYLKIDKEEVIFGNEHFMGEAYQPSSTYVEITNELNADTHFHWTIGTEASFLVQPMYGSIRAYSSLFIHMSYEPDPFKTNQTEIMLKCCKTNNIDLKLKMPPTTPTVTFIESDMNIGKIPLNIPVEYIAVLHNSEFAPATFRVDKNSLLLGIKVYPNSGVIPPRGIKILQIILNFEACVQFTTAIKVTIHNSVSLLLKVSGEVCFPNLKLVPDCIEMKRVSADAQQTHMISAINQGQTVLKLQFLLDKYPEFSVSFFPDEKENSFLDADEVTINSSSTQILYLHFTPIAPASYSFHLPILINGMIGPTNIQDPKTMKPSNYLTIKEDEYSKISGISLMKLPPNLRKIDIDCTVANHLISFNNLNFKFDTSIDMIEDKLIITNHAHEDTSFIIRIDSFQEENSPFQISWTVGEEPKITPLSIVSTLLPKQEITFQIQFKPLEWGLFKLEAPIFVRGQLGGNLYNMLKLEGNNPKGTIESEVQEIYFSPLPLYKEEVQNFILITKNFQTNTEMLVKICNPERRIGLFKTDTLQIEFPYGNSIPKNKKQEVKFSIRVQNPQPVAFSVKVEFFDAKNTSSVSIIVYGIVDNCLLSTYAYNLQNWDNIRKMDTMGTLSKPNMSFYSYKSEKNSQTLNIYPSTDVPLILNSDTNTVQETKVEIFDLPYPHFPINVKDRSFELYMKEIILVAEEWLYADVLNFNFYPAIINGITAAVSGICKTKGKNDKRKKNSIKQSFFNVLEILAGLNFETQIQIPGPLPENNCERITLLLQKYTLMLQFLCAQGAFLAHVSPKFLLNYKDYLMTLGSNKNQTSNLDRKLEDEIRKQIFEARSKQCWLDLILQTYKCFKLSQVGEKNPAKKSDKISRSRKKLDFNLPSIEKESVKIISKKAQVHKNRHYCEGILLAWLEYYFEQEGKKGWLRHCDDIFNSYESEDDIKLKLFNNFDSCLTDGLALIALTRAYCPFLIKEFFSKIYICPRTYEEKLHNAICVVAAWKKIRLGFFVKPMQIVHPNCVHMLMLVTHLYAVLPTYMAKTKIQFSCTLTKSITKKITIKNPTENPVNLVLKFFDNEFEFFSLSSGQRVQKLNPRENKTISIQFEARKIAEAKAYLFVCGSAFGPYFAPNQIFRLEGTTSELLTFNEYSVTSSLYQVFDTVLEITVPYKNEVIYDIWISEEEPKDISTLRMSRWSEIEKRKVPRRLFLNQKVLSVSKNSTKVNLSITVACLSLDQQTYWLIFKSIDNEFITKVTSKCKAPILERLSITYQLEHCSCPNPPTEINMRCLLNIKIMIPSRNAQIWNCINHMLKKVMHLKELPFWSRILETKFGVRLIQSHMGDHHDSLANEISHLFKPCVTYNVTSSDRMKFLRTPDKLQISDAHQIEGEAELILHISHEAPSNYETTLKLRSLDEKEVRIYKVKFLRQE